MQPDFLILENFLGLYKQKISSADYSFAVNDHWSKDALARISFFLFKNNVSNAITNIEIEHLSQSNLAGIAAQTDDLGQNFYYHWENGQRHLLFSLSHVPEGAYQFNNTARFMVYDKEALAATNFNNASSRSSLHLTLKRFFIILFSLLIILYADVFRNIALPMLLVQISSLLNVAIAGIILFKEHSIFNAFTDRFCKSEVYTGCNKLLHSKASIVVGKLSLATFGVAVYFSVFLYSLFAESSDQYIYWTFMLSAGAVLASLLLVIKMVVIRTFCKLCLWIHAINLLSFLGLCLLLLPLVNISFVGYNAMLLWVICFVTASFLVYFVIHFIDTIQKNNASQDEVRSLKLALLESVLLKPKDENLQRASASYRPLAFSFSEDYDLSLTLVLSTHCHFCAELIATIVQQNLTEKIGTLEIYLYSEHTDATVSKFLFDLEHATSETTALALLVDWYKEDRGPRNRLAGAASEERLLPSFCLSTQDLPYAELPAVFINGIFIPHTFNAKDLEKLLYYFSLPG